MENSAILSDDTAFLSLAVALAIGLLFGLERGWHGLRVEEDERVAGVRTFGLLGLLGGVSGLLAQILQPPVYGLVFLGIAATLTVVYAVNYHGSRDAGITSLVAAMLTFALGSLSALGHMVNAAAAAVLAVLLLGFKPQLHSWLAQLEELEIHATLKLLLISVVMLPILPNRGYGPAQALNPYEIWWMVVMIASISYVGYFSVKVVGPNKGVLLTSLFAGLSSSTALTLHLARLSRASRTDPGLLASGILIANTTLFPRVAVITLLLEPSLLQRLALPLSVMTLLVSLPSLLLWRQRTAARTDANIQLENPLDMKTALRFGAFLALVMLAGKLLADNLGESGVLGLAAISGIADLNAITLSVARMTGNNLDPATAAMAITLATAVNALAKSVISLVIGGFAIGWRVGVPLLTASLAGLALAWSGIGFDWSWV
jgi:uncharacterized membrane protein (DUF4010 family)